jgi:hypothetical protein
MQSLEYLLMIVLLCLRRHGEYFSVVQYTVSAIHQKESLCAPPNAGDDRSELSESLREYE